VNINSKTAVYLRMRYMILLFVLCACACTPKQQTNAASSASTSSATAPVPAANDSIVPAAYDDAGKLVKTTKPDDAWKAMLTAKEFNVLRQEGTEYAFSGDLWNHHEKGIYTCRGCHLPLFRSETKFDSGTGWPSFYQPIDPKHITENRDESHGMTRVEVECARCGGHQGHVFDDGPRPTGLRYCINSVSLDFVKD
jgi:peptide-methionine (R)-S-oxide reductase